MLISVFFEEINSKKFFLKCLNVKLWTVEVLKISKLSSRVTLLRPHVFWCDLQMLC